MVVAGSGATGLAAALTLCEGGASVALFEKQRALGGTSNFFHGTFAVESQMQRERFIDYSRDEAFTNIMEYSHWKANARLVRAIVDESAATIAWLQEQGVEFTGQMINMPGAPSTYHVVKGDGEAVVKALATRAKSRGAQILPGTPVIALSKKDGRITGVVVDDDGHEVEVAAQAVVIATGGYLNNREWVKKYTGHDLGVDLIAVGNTGKMGDGIRMAWEAGAAEDGTGVLELVRVAPVGPEFAMGNDLEVVAMQPDLYVICSRRALLRREHRFPRHSLGQRECHGSAATVSPSACSTIRSLEHVIESGVDRGLTTDVPPGYKPENVRTELSAATRQWQHRSLRGRLGGRARPRDRYRPRRPLRHRGRVQRLLRQGARRAVRQTCQVPAAPASVRSTTPSRPAPSVWGRWAASGSTRRWKCWTSRERAIPGLYAGGFDAGGMYGDSYPIRVSSGLSSAFAVNSGRIAGRNAVRYLGR